MELYEMRGQVRKYHLLRDLRNSVQKTVVYVVWWPPMLLAFAQLCFMLFFESPRLFSWVSLLAMFIAGWLCANICIYFRYVRLKKAMLKQVDELMDV